MCLGFSAYHHKLRAYFIYSITFLFVIAENMSLIMIMRIRWDEQLFQLVFITCCTFFNATTINICLNEFGLFFEFVCGLQSLCSWNRIPGYKCENILNVYNRKRTIFQYDDEAYITSQNCGMDQLL